MVYSVFFINENYLKNRNMKIRLMIAMKNQSMIPIINGLTPTAFSALRDKPAPIKKRVSVKHCFATDAIPSVMSCGIGK